MLNQKSFIEKANKVHGNKYDYSKTQYEGSNKKVIITCKVHGDFEQLAAGHLRGFHCTSCKHDERKDSKTSFVQKAKKVHKSKYDYSKVVYTHSQKKVIIICKVHGEFLQVPNNHIMGQDCPECARKKRVKKLLNSRHAKKSYLLNGVEYKTQGYENFALDYLINSNFVKPKDILIGEDVPTFKYKTKLNFAKNPYFKNRLYIPDIVVPRNKLIFEVKSLYTLKMSYDNLLEKRKAVIKKGYNFHLLIFKQNGQLIKVPNLWYKSNYEDLINYLK